MQVQIPQDTLRSWQDLLNLLAKLANIPAALIMRLNDDRIEVFSSSETEDNPYKKGASEVFEGSGLYCEHVIKTQKKLFIPNALTDHYWKDNPDVKLNMISYLGLPLNYPNGDPFGTLCILDKEENAYSDTINELLDKMQEFIQQHLSLLVINKKLLAKEMVASMTQLVTGVAHEINTPLGIGITAISSSQDNIKYLKDHYANKSLEKHDFEERLGDIDKACKLTEYNLLKAADLIRNFKQLSASQLPSEVQRINLKKYLQDLCNSLINLTLEENHIIDLQCEDSLSIDTIPELLSQVIINLVQNSVIHGFEGRVDGEIKIQVMNKEHYIEFLYSDNGVGINKEVKDKIFMPFFTTRRTLGNVGLGMSVIKNIIYNKLNGDFKFLDCDKGVSFQFLITKVFS